MQRYTFLERKTYDVLPDGRARVYYDEQVGSESVTHKLPDSEEETTDTYPVYSYKAVEAESTSRADIIVALIRTSYSQNDELAIQRQQDDKPVEHSVYSAFVEWCKAFATHVLEGETLATVKGIKIAELGQYDASDTIRSFYVNGTPVWLSPNRRNNLRSYCETLGSGQDVPFMGALIPVETAIAMLARVEKYAGDTTIVTETHASAINALDNIAAVQAYDFTTGYPTNPRF